MSKYYRRKILDGTMGWAEEISEEVALDALEEVWNDPDLLLDEGERLSCGGYLYWKEE